MSDNEPPPETMREFLERLSQLPISLAEKQARYRERSAARLPQFAVAYDSLVAHLETLSIDSLGPQVGDTMPEFLLPNEKGELTSLRRLLTAGPVIVSLHRGHWCPYCRLDLRALAGITPEIRRRGAQFVAIMPDKAQYTKQSIAENQLPFQVLSDIDLSYALSLGMVHWLGSDVIRLYQATGIDLERYNDNRSYLLPIVGKFVVRPDGIVAARAVDVDFRQRAEPQAILDALDRL